MSEPIIHAPDCAANNGLYYKCTCGAWQKAQQAPPPDAATPRTDALLKRDRTTDDETDFMRQLERELAEAQAKAAAALSIAEDARKELATWKKAVDEATMGKLAWFPSIQQLPADEGAIRAIVDALENEHRHVERLLDLFSCPTVNATLSDAKERMKHMAGMLERLANPPLFMPRET